MAQEVSQSTEKSSKAIRIALAVNGRTDVALSVREITWDQLCARLSTPKVGQKDGSYYVRGGELTEPKRADENLKEADVAIIDGDSSFDPETGEIVQGAPALPDVVKALEEIGISFFTHTTHSYRRDEQTGKWIWKYRVLIPAKMKSPDELDAVVSYMIDQLHQRQIWITDVPENRRWSQPWYMPRVASKDDMAFFRHHKFDGKPIDVAGAVRWRNERRKQEDAERSLPSAPPASQAFTDGSSGTSAIDAFNDAHDLNFVRSMLESQGYRFVYLDKRGPGGEAYRYIRPGSSSGTPGVVVFKGARGHWCVYSHHGAEDPLSSKVSDPFDLVATFKHNGDRKAAARALLPKSRPEPSVAEKISARQAQGAPTAQTIVGTQPIAPDTFPQKLAQPAQVASEVPKRVIQLVPWQELQDVKVKWLVKDMVPAKAFSAIYGRSGAGKSFFAMYLAAMIASGREAFGCDVEQGSVVYLALEGGAGLRRRRDALIQRYELPDDLPVHFVKTQLNLRSSLEDMDGLISAIKDRGITPSVIFIDTLARAFAGGEENSSAEMMQFVSVIGALMEAFDCAVTVVHHTGKDESRGMRGSSALLAAVDAELELTRISDDEADEPVCTVKSTKQKDGMDGLTWSFRLDLMNVSKIDPDATSLVVNPLTEAHQPKKRKRASGNQKVLLDALKKAVQEVGNFVGIDGIPSGQKVVHVDSWRNYFDVSTHLQGDSARRVFDREVGKLGQDGQISMRAKYCWIPMD